MTELLVARGVRKSFGTVNALRDASLTVNAGEVVGLLGDNGAGKSTFIKVLSGDIAPDRGEIRFLGRPHHPRSPADARAMGIETVYQDLGLCAHLTVARNLFLGREITHGRSGILDDRRMVAEAERYLLELSLKGVSGRALVGQLSGGQRQAIAVAKAVAFEPQLLVLDEPTAALGIREVETVLQVIREVRGRGVGVILITHRMQDLFEVCDRLTIMYDGRTVGELVTADTTLDEIVRYIDGDVGTEVAA